MNITCTYDLIDLVVFVLTNPLKNWLLFIFPGIMLILLLLIQALPPAYTGINCDNRLIQQLSLFTRIKISLQHMTHQYTF